MRYEFKIEKLSDDLGVYHLDVTYTACRHTRRISPGQLARKFGWEATLYEIRPKLVCTKCNHRGATIEAREIRRPRGYKSH